MANIKVLMMGGPRCGKTSVLASLLYQIQNGRANDIFTLYDRTPLANDNDCMRDSLIKKRLELENYIHKGKNKTFICDQGPTASFWKYIFQLNFPRNDLEQLDMEFIDTPGSLFDNGNRYYDEIKSIVKECDIFVVIVDTPFLMEGTEVEAHAANIIESIYSSLMQIDNRDGREFKKVIFVPTKCEKWVKDCQIDKVVNAVEKQYDFIIKNLKALKKTEISIIPVETTGDIVFCEFQTPYILLNKKTCQQTRCSMISKNIVRLQDGKIKKMSDDEILAQDSSAFFCIGEESLEIVRPEAWFCLNNGSEAVYSPKNCDQLLLHIVRFALNKKKHELQTMQTFIPAFRNNTVQDIQNVLNLLSQKDLITDNGNGIKIINECF